MMLEMMRFYRPDLLKVEAVFFVYGDEKAQLSDNPTTAKRNFRTIQEG